MSRRNWLVVVFVNLVFLVVFWCFNSMALNSIRENNNLIISSIISKVKNSDLDVTDEEIVAILNDPDLSEDEELKRYGIDIKKMDISLRGNKLYRHLVWGNVVIIFLFLVVEVLVLFVFAYVKGRKIDRLTEYLREINRKNYNLDIMENSEDDYSVLKNEIYKTSVLLNEQNLLLEQDKESLKEALENISHQLKTPLTSMSLVLENLEDLDFQDKKSKDKMISDLKKKVHHINFFIQELLKLSKFDAHAILLKNDYYKVRDIIDSSYENVAVLLELKNMRLNIEGKKDVKLFCDFKWQVEAISNILKNCIEYSPDGSVIDISFSASDVMVKIAIKDYGKGMNKKDLKNVFTRFYKGENSSSTSVGIGMSLAQAIILKNNGSIYVDSSLGKGTSFVIKYLR